MKDTNEKLRTFRGFETLTDAETFKKFIIAIGYENVDIEKFEAEQLTLYRVWFDYH